MEFELESRLDQEPALENGNSSLVVGASSLLDLKSMGRSTETSETLQPKAEGNLESSEVSQKKYPLGSTWRFWSQEPIKHLPKGRQPAKVETGWEDKLRPIGTVTAISEFWNVMNHLKPPSGAPTGVMIACFKDDIRPAWESAPFHNHKGGRYIITTSAADAVWLELLLNMIGQQFPRQEHICGVTAMMKQKHSGRVEIWAKDHSTGFVTELESFVDSLVGNLKVEDSKRIWKPFGGK